MIVTLFLDFNLREENGRELTGVFFFTIFFSWHAASGTGYKSNARLLWLVYVGMGVSCEALNKRKKKTCCKASLRWKKLLKFILARKHNIVRILYPVCYTPLSIVRQARSMRLLWSEFFHPSYVRTTPESKHIYTYHTHGQSNMTPFQECCGTTVLYRTCARSRYHTQLANHEVRRNPRYQTAALFYILLIYIYLFCRPRSWVPL